MLGVKFDPKLSTLACIQTCVHKAAWRFRSLLHTFLFLMIRSFQVYLQHLFVTLWNTEHQLHTTQHRRIYICLKPTHWRTSSCSSFKSPRHCDARRHTSSGLRIRSSTASSLSSSTSINIAAVFATSVIIRKYRATLVVVPSTLLNDRCLV